MASSNGRLQDFRALGRGAGAAETDAAGAWTERGERGARRGASSRMAATHWQSTGAHWQALARRRWPDAGQEQHAARSGHEQRRQGWCGPFQARPQARLGQAKATR